jgi:flagellin
LKTYNVSSASLLLETAALLAANKVKAGAAATAKSLAAGGDAAAQTAASDAAIAAMTSSKLDISTNTALTTISAAIDTVSGYKAEWGAGQNRLEYTVSNLMNVVEFTSAARSRIQDADFAAEAAKLAKAQVLQQTGAAMLAQANAAPQLALQLIK